MKGKTRILNLIRERLAITLGIALLLYGAFVLVRGTLLGVYLTNQDSLLHPVSQLIFFFFNHGESVSKTTDSYNISFYSAAAQDFWFFLIFGFVLSVTNARDPKTDELQTKISHLFPEVKKDLQHMEFLEKEINSASCTATLFYRRMVITEVDGDFIKILLDTRLKLKNLHHNTPLDANFGDFELVPDDKVLGKFSLEPWGTLHHFKLVGNEDPIRGYEPVSGEKLLIDNVELQLEPGETKVYDSQLEYYKDINKPTKVGFLRFTKELKFRIQNTTDTRLKLTVELVRSGDRAGLKERSFYLDKGQEEVVSKEMLTPYDQLVITYEKENQKS